MPVKLATPPPAAADEVLRPATVYGAIAQVMRLVGPVGKTERNTQSNFMYRGIDQILNALQPAMAEVGLVIHVEQILSIEYLEVVVGKNKTTMQSVRVRVQFAMIGPDGSKARGEMVGESFDSGDKATSKAITMAEKSFLITTFKIPVADNADPDGESYERAQPEGRTHGGDPYQEQQAAPAGPNWKDLYDKAVARGIPALVGFADYARAQGAPVVVVQTAEQTLADLRATEQAAADADRAEQPERHTGNPDTRQDATKSVVPESAANDSATRQAVARFTTRLNAVLKPEGGGPVNPTRLDALVREAEDQANKTGHDSWAAAYTRAVRAVEENEPPL